MEVFVSVGVVLALIIFYLGIGVWVFAGLLLVSATSLWLLLGMSLDRIGIIGASIVYRYSSTWELAAIPMFIWMGEIIFRTDISDRLFLGLVPFVYRIPGRLLHTTVVGCTLFAAVSGSSAATTATVGKITTTELEKRGYNRSLSIGSLAGAGSIGFLIPPSIIMIVYGILAEVSISRLFAAGVLPGLMVVGLFSSYIILCALVRPSIVPASEERFALRDYWNAIIELSPIVVLMVVVLGSIYSGVATPSEAAAIGVGIAIVVTIAMRQMSLQLFVDTLLGAIRTSCMVSIILVSAAFLASAMGYLHIPAQIGQAISSLDLSPWQLMLVLSLFYIILGLFLDGVSIIVMSLPITFPLAIQAGFDPITFGIYLVIMVEMALVTPPIGFNLFIIHGLTGEPMSKICIATLPFFCLMGVAVALIWFFPEIALWLPRALYG